MGDYTNFWATFITFFLLCFLNSIDVSRSLYQYEYMFCTNLKRPVTLCSMFRDIDGILNMII